MNNNKRPVAFVSFEDLRHIGFHVFVKEFDKEKPGGQVVTAVKVVKVEREAADGTRSQLPRHAMMELLYSLGIDTRDPSLHVWVTPKKRHRCLHKKDPVYDYRYSGYERVDDIYLRSGRASKEAIMYDSNFSDIDDETYKMENGG